MKYLYKVLFFLLAISLFSACKSFQVYPVSEMTEESEAGIMYHLPMQIIQIEVHFKKVSHQHGPFASFASKYFGHKNAIASNSAYSIEDLSISSYSVPDPELKFWIEMGEDNLKRNQRLNVKLSKEGVLSWVKIGEISGKDKKQKKQIKNIEKEIFEIKDTEKEDITIIPEAVLYSKVNDENANLLYEQIQEIRKQKNRILTGYQEIAYAPNTIQFMYHQLHAQEEQILNLFYGTSKCEKFSKTYTFIPKRNQKEGSFILFRFSEEDGIKEPSETSYPPVVLQYAAEEVEKPIFESDDSKGIHYLVPASTEIIIKRIDDVLAKKDFMISQYGYVNYLPSNTQEVKLNAENGSLIFVKYAP